MIKIFRAGSDVPEWLFKRVRAHDKATCLTFIFPNLSLVYAFRGGYHIWPLRHSNDSGTVYVNANSMSFEGQSPKGFEKFPVVYDRTPFSYLLAWIRKGNRSETRTFTSDHPFTGQEESPSASDSPSS